MPADLGPALDAHLAGVVDAHNAYALVTVEDINAMLGLERMKDAVNCSDTACAADIGGALGVDLMLSPQATALGDVVEITITLIDVRHAQVLGRKQGRVPRDEKFLAKGIDEAVGQLIGSQPIDSAPPDTMPIVITTDNNHGYMVEADVHGDKSACEHAVTPARSCSLHTAIGDTQLTARAIGNVFRLPLHLRLSYMPDGYSVNFSSTGSLALTVVGGTAVAFGFFGIVGSALGFALGGEGTGFAVLGGGIALAGLGGWALYAGIPSDNSTVSPGATKTGVSLARRWIF